MANVNHGLRGWRWILLVAGFVGFGCGSAAPSKDAGTKDAAMEAQADRATEAASQDAEEEVIQEPDAAVEAGAGTDAADAAVETSAGTDAADAAAEEVVGGVTVVGTFGCFAKSGDGADYFENGMPAVIVTTSPWRAPCGSAWISTNANGYTKMELPVTEILTKTFVVDSLINDRATFTVSFEADDEAEIVLNGHSIATCSAAANIAECQMSCHIATFAKTDLMPAGQPNHLQIKMINTLNANAGGGNLGYTGISYSICATGE